MRQILHILFLLYTSLSIAQNYTVTGKIVDKITQESIPYASVVIKDLDNTILTGGITNDDGIFTISKIKKQTIIFEVQFVGYKNHSKEIQFTTKKTDLNTILLEEVAESLEEVVVVAERSTIEQKIDRKIITIGKDLSTAGATASDIMGNLPSVSVNQDGEIALRGNENVRVLIDGKPTNIEASQLLQQIPSSSIKKVELITSPSAKYNPEGMSGIINIILHKNVKTGFNGNVNLGITQGRKTRLNGALGLNYRTGKFNIYANYGTASGENTLQGTIERFTEDFEQSQSNIVDNNSHLVKLGIDFYINDYNTLSFYTNQNKFIQNLSADFDVRFFNNSNNNYGQFYAFEKNNYTETYNLDYKLDFNTNGHYIEFEADYNSFDSENNTFFLFSGNTVNQDFLDDIFDDRTNLTFNLDYVYPISDRTTLELGLESRTRKTDNIYKTTSASFNNSTFIYDTDIQSFYATFRQNLKKWSYQIGARLENYTVNASFDAVNESLETFNDEIFSIYPSAFLKYTPDESQKNSYQLSISRRVDRPSFGQINPIRAFNTPILIAIGNMRLNPQFTNSIEFNYTRKLNKGSLTLGTFYREIEDEINRIVYFDPNDISKLVLDYDNFDRNQAFGFELSANYKPLKWWSVTTSFDIYSRAQKGTILGEKVAVQNTATNFKVNHNFKVFDNTTFQVFSFLSGPQKVLQYELKSNYFVNLGLRQSFANKKGTLSINFNDIFRTQRFAFESFRTVIQRGDLRRDSQAIYLGLSYKFGVGKNKALKRKKRDKNEKRGGLL
ncbi:TonB-dependent receptor domain-containing protein [Tenacibaculum agarivorans]|uniref:TonB-dependent receptor domain-containing protein n=1 Tax=Tenacibaculum agarivorans TaxID=1908389 RepID=UPI00094BBD83|nr:outer membrane beta-barrel family protein [Tenacibaculum agarivorans]